MEKKEIEMFQDKNILVTGGTGSIGSELVKQLLKFKCKQIRIFSRDESKHFFLERDIRRLNSKIDIKYLIGDIRDRDRLSMALRNVDIVFHTAALKHVPYCEYNPFEAIKTNIQGTQNLINLAIDMNISRVVAISTDKAVYPNTIMGVTKLLMERMIISTKSYIGPSITKFAVVRFGNVLSTRGSVVPTWIEQIQNGGPVTVTSKSMKRYFMSVFEAVNLILLATTMMLGQEIFVLKMKEKKIYDLALETIRNYSKKKKVKIKIIGPRDREKMREQLYTKEESKLMFDLGKFYIIQPSQTLLKNRKRLYKI